MPVHYQGTTSDELEALKNYIDNLSNPGSWPSNHKTHAHLITLKAGFEEIHNFLKKSDTEIEQQVDTTGKQEKKKIYLPNRELLVFFLENRNRGVFNVNDNSHIAAKDAHTLALRLQINLLDAIYIESKDWLQYVKTQKDISNWNAESYIKKINAARALLIQAEQYLGANNNEPESSSSIKALQGNGISALGQQQTDALTSLAQLKKELNRQEREHRLLPQEPAHYQTTAPADNIHPVPGELELYLCDGQHYLRTGQEGAYIWYGVKWDASNATWRVYQQENLTRPSLAYDSASEEWRMRTHIGLQRGNNYTVRTAGPPSKGDADASYDLIFDALTKASIKKLSHSPKESLLFIRLVKNVISEYNIKRNEVLVDVEPGQYHQRLAAVTLDLPLDGETLTLGEKNNGIYLRWCRQERFIAGTTLATLTARLWMDMRYHRHKNSYDLSDIESQELFRKADFKGADFRGANFSWAGFSGVDLSGTYLMGANFWHANLSEANLKDADLRNANLNETNLRKAHLRGANLKGANLSGANLRDTNLSEANLKKAILWKANLRKANLSKADLREVDFRWVYFQGADFSGANLTDANLSEARLRGTNLKEANLSKANLWKANLKKANLMSTDLTDANLSETDLSGADFSGADLSRARVTLSLPVIWNTQNLDAYLNHTANNGCSLIMAINSIDPRFTALKIDMMRQLMVSIDPWITWESYLRQLGKMFMTGTEWTIDLDPYIQSLQDCLQSGYMVDRTIVRFTEKHVIPLVIAWANRGPWRTGSAQTCQNLLNWMQKKKQDEFAIFSLKNNGFFIQLILNSRHSGDNGVIQQAKTLYEQYLKLERIHQYTARDYHFGDGAGVLNWEDKNASHYILIADRKERHTVQKQTMLLSENQLNAMLENDENTHWNRFHYYLQTDSGPIQTPSSTSNLWALFNAHFKFLAAPYNTVRSLHDVIYLLIKLDPKNDHQNLVDTLKNDSMNKKWISTQAGKILADIFNKVLIPEAGQESRYRISEAHYQDIVKIFGINKSPARAQAETLTLLATLFTRYSSNPIFGMEQVLPKRLREYAALLLSRAWELDPYIFRLDGKTNCLQDWQHSLYREDKWADDTVMLFNKMWDYSKRYFSPATIAIIPLAWWDEEVKPASYPGGTAPGRTNNPKITSWMLCCPLPSVKNFRRRKVARNIKDNSSRGKITSP